MTVKYFIVKAINELAFNSIHWSYSLSLIVLHSGSWRFIVVSQAREKIFKDGVRCPQLVIILCSVPCLLSLIQTSCIARPRWFCLWFSPVHTNLL